mmetsp:Transcript_76370/g.212163  ORF Transcript_76370/g.212163 Transcript_76370/m.212163 type:complete len:205 (-) Transcript_76370:496-1110(-)
MQRNSCQAEDFGGWFQQCPIGQGSVIVQEHVDPHGKTRHTHAIVTGCLQALTDLGKAEQHERSLNDHRADDHRKERHAAKTEKVDYLSQKRDRAALDRFVKPGVEAGTAMERTADELGAGELSCEVEQSETHKYVIIVEELPTRDHPDQRSSLNGRFAQQRRHDLDVIQQDHNCKRQASVAEHPVTLVTIACEADDNTPAHGQA